MPTFRIAVAIFFLWFGTAVAAETIDQRVDRAFDEGYAMHHGHASTTHRLDTNGPAVSVVIQEDLLGGLGPAEKANLALKVLNRWHSCSRVWGKLPRLSAVPFTVRRQYQFAPDFPGWVVDEESAVFAGSVSFTREGDHCKWTLDSAPGF